MGAGLESKERAGVGAWRGWVGAWRNTIGKLGPGWGSEHVRGLWICGLGALSLEGRGLGTCRGCKVA